MPMKQSKRSMRAIVERDPRTRRWHAWFEDDPDDVYAGDEALAAFDRLVSANRGRVPDAYHLKIDDRFSRGGHIEVVVWSAETEAAPCPACHGSGKYVGLVIVEECKTCGGSGTVMT